MSDRIGHLVERALDGSTLDVAEIEELLTATGDDVALIVNSALDLGRKLGDGVGMVFAQIGVDGLPCPENCRFCAFAECNTDASMKAQMQADDNGVVSIERIVEFASTFNEAGVQLVSLMATAGLPFERYLQIVHAVRNAIGTDMPILANVMDVTAEQARMLKDAGANAAYHAIRLAEGRITDISPDARRQTLRNMRDAGLAIMTGIEPVWMGANVPEMAQIISEIPSYHPFCIGACALVNAEGTAMAKAQAAPPEYVRLVASVLRLVVGKSCRYGGIGAIKWVDAGCDPRARDYGSSKEHLLKEVRKAKERLNDEGWSAMERPSLSILG